MERIEFIREQIRVLKPEELFDLVMMIRYELGLRFSTLPDELRIKCDDLCILVAKWEEEGAEVTNAKPS